MNSPAVAEPTAQRPDDRPRPTVSVIIATYHRPQLALQAVHSALDQTFGAIEVLVILDGPDPATKDALVSIPDPRLRVLIAPHNMGQAAATNLAIAEARGPWIALLDDDDLWLPTKLERQLAVARQSPHPYPIVSCRLIARNESGDFLWPRRLPEPGESLDEYLFCRRWPTTGEGMVQNSTLLAPASLFKIAPFTAGLKRFVDLDWLLRVNHVAGAAVSFDESGDPLVVWHIETSRRRVSNQHDWHWGLAYIRERRQSMTPRAYGAFLLTLISASAARQHAWSAFFPLLREAFGQGRPGWIEVLNHVANFGLPRGAQSAAAGLCESRRRAGD